MSRDMSRKRAILCIISTAAVALISLLVAAAFGRAAPGRASAQSPQVAQQQTDCLLFKETDKSICGNFLRYWLDHEGLAQQGYPISGEFQEKSATDGKTYMVQYFERVVFEYHPENKPPYDFLLSQLGTSQYREKYSSVAPGQQPWADNMLSFKETGKTLGGRFRAYWEQSGGLAQFGYPISDPFTEVSDLNGKPYMVQYFERAVFEYHSENKPPFDVLLSQLGTLQFRHRYGSNPTGSVGSAPPGTMRTVSVPTFTSTPISRSGPLYVFPVQPVTATTYGPYHHDYPATDIFCPIGSHFVAPTNGVVDYVTTTDKWDPATDDPAVRGGPSVAVIGDDGVRYYGSHLSKVSAGIVPGVRVTSGQLLGLTGKSGDARFTDPHLHFGISPPTTPTDWKVRRGTISPYKCLRAWAVGTQLQPVLK